MTTTSYEAAPWLSSYNDGMPASIAPPHDTMLDVFDAAVALAPDQTAIRFFDGRLTLAELNDAADALASGLIAHGYSPGDRLALYVQNDPSFIIGLIAAWKSGGIPVAVNPMNKARELTNLLTDSGATAIICLDSLLPTVRTVIDSGAVPHVQKVITCSAKDFQSRNDHRVMEPIGDLPVHESLRLDELLTDYRGGKPAGPRPNPVDTAVLTYTSGTTGVPKAALNTHRAMSFNSYTFREWVSLSPDDSILGIAPLFHITGLVGYVGTALAAPCPLVLTHRFESAVTLEALREHRPTYTVAAITAFTVLLSHSAEPARDFESLRAIYSGGAPVSPALADDFSHRTGRQIHNIYGLTETTSVCHATTLGAAAPVDPRTGALSVGLPVFNTFARVLDDDGNEALQGISERSPSRVHRLCPATGTSRQSPRKQSLAVNSERATSASWTPRGGSISSTARRT